MAEKEHREEILSGIARRAPFYTPEWRYNPGEPDAGTALAMLWADMHAGTLERFDSLPDNFMRSLFDLIGSEPRPAVPASGFLTFAVREDAGDIVVPEGTAVAAPSDPEAVLVTLFDLAACSARICCVYSVMPKRDSVRRFDREGIIEFNKPSLDIGHTWTFTHSFALDVSYTADLRITPRTDDETLRVLADSPWEFSDGGVWRGLSVIRDGASLLYSFPPDKTRCDAVRVTVTEGGVLSGMTAKPSGRALLPDALYAESAEESDGFLIFGQRFIPGTSAYFSCADALTKHGAEVELILTLDYEEFLSESYTETQVQMKKLMRASDFEPPPEYRITACNTKWEYFNGIGWAVLDTDAPEDIFGGGEGGHVRVAFTCPADMHPVVIGAHELPFIRVRLVEADNLYRLRGRFIAPRVSDIRFHYRFPGGLEITDISVREHLDFDKKTMPVKLAGKPQSPDAVYFAFDAPFTRGSVLFDIGAAGKPGGKRWEYLTESGWVPLSVHDETECLSKTGLLSYQAQDTPKLARLWGCDAYWLRLAAVNGSLRCGYIRGIYENAVRAAARTGGKSSELAPCSFTSILGALPGVESASNPIAVHGGAEAEDEDTVINRISSSLSHSGRAVSRFDCEALAKEASLRVKSARYYPHTDENGRYAYGVSCLAVYAHDAQGLRFDELRAELNGYITPRRALCAERLVIIPPRFVTINVSAQVLIASYGEALAVKNRITKALKVLLSPDNREIGTLPAPGQIGAVIRAQDGVLRLLRSGVEYVMGPGGTCAHGQEADSAADAGDTRDSDYIWDVGYAGASREAFVLPVAGRYDIDYLSFNKP